MPVDTTVVRDVVVVVPGIMGSELVDHENRPVWAVSAGALIHAIRTLGKSLQNLQLPEGIGDNEPDDPKKQMKPTRLIDSLHVIPGLWSPITGYDGLLNFLRSSRFHLIEKKAGAHDGRIPNLIPFPYDWRLSNVFNAKRLAKEAIDALDQWRKQPGMGDAKLVLICHSMGGLIAQYFAEKLGGAEIIRSIITIGTPHRGALNSLATLVNGLEPKIGPLRLSLTEFARSLPSIYQLLPQYNCVVTEGGRVSLGQASCPNLNGKMLNDAFEFHQAIGDKTPSAYVLHKVVGIRQPTATTVRIISGKAVVDEEIDGRNQGGDGTVPFMAAEPLIGYGSNVQYVAGQHGELQDTRSLKDLVDGILTAQDIVRQASQQAGFGVEMEEIWSDQEPLILRVRDADDERLLVKVQDEKGASVKLQDGSRFVQAIPVSKGVANLGRLPEGGYSAMVYSSRPGGPRTVTKPFLVINEDVEP